MPSRQNRALSLSRPSTDPPVSLPSALLLPNGGESSTFSDTGAAPSDVSGRVPSPGRRSPGAYHVVGHSDNFASAVTTSAKPQISPTGVSSAQPWSSEEKGRRARESPVRGERVMLSKGGGGDVNSRRGERRGEDSGSGVGKAGHSSGQETPRKSSIEGVGADGAALSEKSAAESLNERQRVEGFDRRTGDVNSAGLGGNEQGGGDATKGGGASEEKEKTARRPQRKSLVGKSQQLERGTMGLTRIDSGKFALPVMDDFGSGFEILDVVEKAKKPNDGSSGVASPTQRSTRSFMNLARFNNRSREAEGGAEPSSKTNRRTSQSFKGIPSLNSRSLEAEAGTDSKGKAALLSTQSLKGIPAALQSRPNESEGRTEPKKMISRGSWSGKLDKLSVGGGGEGRRSSGGNRETDVPPSPSQNKWNFSLSSRLSRAQSADAQLIPSSPSTPHGTGKEGGVNNGTIGRRGWLNRGMGSFLNRTRSADAVPFRQHSEGFYSPINRIDSPRQMETKTERRAEGELSSAASEGLGGTSASRPIEDGRGNTTGGDEDSRYIESSQGSVTDVTNQKQERSSVMKPPTGVVPSSQGAPRGRANSPTPNETAESPSSLSTTSPRRSPFQTVSAPDHEGPKGLSSLNQWMPSGGISAQFNTRGSAGAASPLSRQTASSPTQDKTSGAMSPMFSKSNAGFSPSRQKSFRRTLTSDPPPSRQYSLNAPLDPNSESSTEDSSVERSSLIHSLVSPTSLRVSASDSTDQSQDGPEVWGQLTSSMKKMTCIRKPLTPLTPKTSTVAQLGERGPGEFAGKVRGRTIARPKLTGETSRQLSLSKTASSGEKEMRQLVFRKSLSDNEGDP